MLELYIRFIIYSIVDGMLKFQLTLLTVVCFMFNFPRGFEYILSSKMNVYYDWLADVYFVLNSGIL